MGPFELYKISYNLYLILNNQWDIVDNKIIIHLGPFLIYIIYAISHKWRGKSAFKVVRNITVTFYLFIPYMQTIVIELLERAPLQPLFKAYRLHYNQWSQTIIKYRLGSTHTCLTTQGIYFKHI